MTFILEAAKRGKKVIRWQIQCDSILLAAQEAQDHARLNDCTVYLFTSQGICVGKYSK